MWYILTMPRLSKIFIIFVFLLGLFNLAYALNNDYQSSTSYDSYSQSWQSYKQQNNIKTENYVQQSWWSKTFSNVTNLLADIGASINKALNNIASFFTSAYNSIKNVFVKTPEIKTNLDTAPPKDINASSTKNINTDLNKSLSNKNTTIDTAKTQGTQKNNPYANLVDKPWNDPRAVGVPQISPVYQKIEAEYAARDKWVADQQGEGKLADTKPMDVRVGAGLAPAQSQDIAAISQQDVAVISPMQITHPDPGIMPAERWENIKNTQIVRDAEQSQNHLSQAKTLVADTIKFTKEDWKNNNNLVDSSGKGFIEGFARDVKNEDLYTPVQKFFQEKSNQLNDVTVSAIKGLNVAYANPNSEKGFLKIADQISIGTMKGCVVVGAVLAQGALDVGKFGSEIPQIMASLTLAQDNFKVGDTKSAMRNIGEALGGVGREAARATVIGSLFKGVGNVLTNKVLVDRVVSVNEAKCILTKNGFSPNIAKDFIGSFDGQINSRLINSGEKFLRYTDSPNSQGNFLSKYVFDDSRNSVASLNLTPYNNQAKYVQVVTAIQDSIALEGRVAGGSVRQTLITNRKAFKFDIGEALIYE